MANQTITSPSSATPAGAGVNTLCQSPDVGLPEQALIDLFTHEEALRMMGEYGEQRLSWWNDIDYEIAHEHPCCRCGKQSCVYRGFEVKGLYGCSTKFSFQVCDSCGHWLSF